MASCMAENELNEPVIGVTLDGTGYGIDEVTHEAVVWGGEFLVGDYRSFRRAVRLRYVAMPGGERAAVEPWRMAVAHLLDAGCELSPLKPRLTDLQLRTAAAMIARRLNSPLTSSAGRLFDAVASIAGACDVMSYEGQAAAELEWLAGEAGAGIEAYPFAIEVAAAHALPDVIDTRPLIRAAAADAGIAVDAQRIARRFHATIVSIIEAACDRIRQQTGLNTVVLSGGVFMNAWLTTAATSELLTRGFRVFRHSRVPPGDGGLCLGQLAVAAEWQRKSDPAISDPPQSALPLQSVTSNP